MQDQTPHNVCTLTKNAYAVILAGGRGSRLHELTDWRAKPAVYFGGKYRIIDFVLSNCINSGVRRVGILTQYKSHSLVRHIVRGWSYFKRELGEGVEILPASQRCSKNWYLGTADAIHQNMDIILSEQPKHVLVLSGDHVYKMDYGEMLVEHSISGAKMSVCCIEVPVAEAANSFGVMQVNESGRVIGFQEKPPEPAHVPGKSGTALASMGNYIFDTDFLLEILKKDAEAEYSSHDFGKDIIPLLIDSTHVHAFSFKQSDMGERAYWRDVGTLDSFWRANMELIDPSPPMDIYDPKWPILTYQEQLPPAKFISDGIENSGRAIGSMVSGGCIISSATLRKTVLFSNVRVNARSLVDSSVVLPKVEIGRNVKIKNAIIDRECQIPDDMRIGYDVEEDRANGFRVSEQGIVLVTRGMLKQAEGLV